MKTKKKSGFEDDPAVKNPCRDRQHEPPQHIVIPQGKIYRHICPSCGRETVIRPPQVTLGAR